MICISGESTLLPVFTGVRPRGQKSKSTHWQLENAIKNKREKAALSRQNEKPHATSETASVSLGLEQESAVVEERQLYLLLAAQKSTEM